MQQNKDKNKDKIKVLMVCHGNICRSTMAQSVLQHMVNTRGISDKFYIDSAATSREEIGNGPHYGTRNKLHQEGIPLIPHQAVQMTKSDYDKYDYLIGMDTANIRNMNRIAGGDPDDKIYKMLSFAGSGRDVADPWYTGDFDATYNDVVAGCEGFLDYIQDSFAGEAENEPLTPSPSIKAVIFDLDGTLIDTEKFYRINWPKALAHFDYHMTDEQALSIRSLGRPFAPQQFKEWFGEDFDYMKVREYRKTLMEASLAEHGIQLKPGAIEILTYLREHGIITALATANEKPRAERYLKKIGLYEYFDHIICADMVAYGKPAPDIYAYACEQLGEKPENCFAVEDSPNGVTSAYTAGCKVIYVPDQTPVDEQVEPMLFAAVEGLMDIRNLLSYIAK